MSADEIEACVIIPSSKVLTKPQGGLCFLYLPVERISGDSLEEVQKPS